MSVKAEPSGKLVAEETVDDRQLAIGSVGAPSLHDRDQVLQISGPRVGHLDPAARLGEASGVDGRQYIRRQIDRQADEFADHRGGDDAAVILGQVERAARQQFIEPLVCKGADPVCEVGYGLRPELARRAATDAVVDRGVEVRVKRHRM